ncbi:ABC transporter substrate-binding protein [Pseudomonas sp. GV071]|jgi:polar amino acid transport system substrate-binding protein|uniref:substrate-binding periplasmic protein n=1 Tax=Pseudomonas sp. GV071 TaxID=2135754 RepID=UPI000D397D93|nr:ABC transporter substrate-binding protein [Pseudomonas sp. GV071]
MTEETDRMAVYARRVCHVFLATLIALPALAFAEPQNTLGKLRVLTEHSPPGEYQEPSGRVTGPTAEMVRELMRRAGETAEIEMHPWKRGYDYALSSQQVALFETTRTREREKLFKWVGPIKRISRGLYTLEENAQPLDNLEQARSSTGICAYNGDSSADMLLQNGFDNLSLPTLPEQCLSMLLHKRVEMWATSDIEKDAFLATVGLPPVTIKRVLELDIRELYIAFSLATPDSTIQRWQRVLDEMKRDGTLAKFYRGTYSDEQIEAVSSVE